MRCQNCGNENLSGAKHCIYCGVKLNNMDNDVPKKNLRKRYCAYCGEKIGMASRYVLIDGGLVCKNCVRRSNLIDGVVFSFATSSFVGYLDTINRNCELEKSIDKSNTIAGLSIDKEKELFCYVCKNRYPRCFKFSELKCAEVYESNTLTVFLGEKPTGMRTVFGRKQSQIGGINVGGMFERLQKAKNLILYTNNKFMPEIKIRIKDEDDKNRLVTELKSIIKK